MKKSVFLGTLAATTVLAGAAFAGTLDDVKARGELICGANPGLDPVYRSAARDLGTTLAEAGIGDVALQNDGPSALGLDSGAGVLGIACLGFHQGAAKQFRGLSNDHLLRQAIFFKQQFVGAEGKFEGDADPQPQIVTGWMAQRGCSCHCSAVASTRASALISRR